MERQTLGLYILKSDIRLPMEYQSGGPASSRVLGTYNGEPVLVEWKHYSYRLHTSAYVYIRQRTAMLVMQLQQSANMDGFGILKCLGHFEEPDSRRVGMVFQVRASTASKSSSFNIESADSGKV